MAPWFWYAVVAAVLYGAHQIFTRLASDHIGDGLGGFVVEATAALSILLYLAALWLTSRWNQKFSAAGFGYSALTGVCVGAGTIAFFLLFQKAGPLSAVPAILAVGAAMMAIAGILFFKEPASPLRLLGVMMSITGLLRFVGKRFALVSHDQHLLVGGAPVRLGFDARLRLCYSSTDAQDSCNPTYGRAGDVYHATAASGGIVHPVERPEPGGLQEQLLRKHDLLRCLEGKHGPCISAARAERCSQTPVHWLSRSCAHRLSCSVVSTGASCLRNRAGSRAFAAASHGDLHSSHLIQRR